MPIITPEQYYENEDLYGGSQYVSFKDILDGLLMEIESDDDHYLKGIKRPQMMRCLKNAIREVHPKASNRWERFEITVPASLVFPLPQDYLNYTMVSLVGTDSVTGSIRLYPLDINYNINIAEGFLQDDTGNILFDNDGFILTADSSNAYASPYQTYAFCSAYQPMLDTSKLSKYGEFTIDTNRGYILFSSNLAEQEIVFEYISDGLKANEADIEVNKFLRSTIENLCYYYAIERKRHVPESEKRRALNRFKTTLHQSKLDLSDISMLRIARVLRSKNMLL